LPEKVSISVVVATLDRPEGLRQCLHSLTEQTLPGPVEIVVVDNHPASGITARVVAEFPHVILVNEPRRGLAYARNKGFIASTGQIVVTTDDDITMPPGWLEKLITPFTRPQVMAVTGNVLPLELDTRAQRLYEAYGGLGRGAEPQIADGTWFRKFRTAVPTWKLGATANAAFRAEIFSHPQIGLMDEALGPGMPSGVGEDTYLFYKILKAGYTIVYEPNAFVWHQHRREMPELRRQLYDYSKGHVAYNLTTLLRDHDLRALVQIGLVVPAWHLLRAVRRLCGKSQYPLSLVLLEVSGNLAGPWSLWKSRMRVRREGHSGPYVPVSRRSAMAAESSQLVSARKLRPHGTQEPSPDKG
jgi:glycosyltransferase involved in cell wall biosynthesis